MSTARLGVGQGRALTSRTMQHTQPAALTHAVEQKFHQTINNQRPRKLVSFHELYKIQNVFFSPAPWGRVRLKSIIDRMRSGSVAPLGPSSPLPAGRRRGRQPGGRRASGRSGRDGACAVRHACGAVAAGQAGGAPQHSQSSATLPPNILRVENAHRHCHHHLPHAQPSQPTLALQRLPPQPDALLLAAVPLLRGQAWAQAWREAVAAG